MTPDNSYPNLDVTSWKLDRIETIGADEKYWLTEPGSGQRWLFKANNTHENESGAWSQREDISEKVAGELGLRMGIPCAAIEFATRDKKLGCISRDLRPPEWELQTGAVVLDGLLDGYVPGYELSNKLRIGHSLRNIRTALTGYGPPPESALPGDFDAFDTFVGYTVFDAVIANRDRHDENWAVMRPPDELPGALAGSFDHARALGSALRESKLAAIIANNQVDDWVMKGTAWRYERLEGSVVPTLVQLTSEALQLVRPGVRTYWLERVDAIKADDVSSITSKVREMSEAASTFIERVVTTNRKRVLDDC